MNIQFQSKVWDWGKACFGEIRFNNKATRGYRFIEEALELVQSTGITKGQVQQLVDYVFERPAGVPFQEFGGVALTLCSMASVNHFILEDCATVELQRCWDRIEKIREKENAKPVFTVKLDGASR